MSDRDLRVLEAYEELLRVVKVRPHDVEQSSTTAKIQLLEEIADPVSITASQILTL